MKIIIRRNKNRFYLIHALSFMFIGATIALAIKSQPPACLKHVAICKKITTIPEKIKRLINKEIERISFWRNDKEVRKSPGTRKRIRRRRRNTLVEINENH